MSDELRRRIVELAAEFAAKAHAPAPFKPGETPIPASGKVFGGEELSHLVDSALDFWLTEGRFNDAFEKRLSGILGNRHVVTVNSGSSANLLAVASLTSPELGDRALKPGDEVITVAAGFPTTVNPLLLYGLVPVFVDIDLPTYNIRPSLIEPAVTKRTRAIMIAHTLGNPFDLGEVMRVAQKHGLWVIEDCCDALGSTYDGRIVGTFGDVGTLSFYPAHQITTGEGGAIFAEDGRVRKIIKSHRDWGRDCWCAPGKDNTCGKRFEWQLGELPAGYDHKYIYSHLGYNLKMTDMQAAVGLAQLSRLPDFIAARKRNFAFLSRRLAGLADRLILPEATPKSDPCWFGFPITIRREAGVERRDLVRHLDAHKIGTRQLFGGNLIRQPYFRNRTYRVVGSLETSDLVMERTFWVGVYPGLREEHLEFLASHVESFVARR
jgi:CDP-6-deoxy-D-xylo-4-hexulose-3-dehydrase